MKAPDNFLDVPRFKMTTSSTAKLTVPARILLVDDNVMGLRARKLVLEELGYKVTALCCSLEALEQFSSQSFDLLVTDYKMPNLDGMELIAHVRQRRSDLPIVLLSGFAEALGLNERNTGADVVIQKNCHEIGALTRAVGRLLGRRTPRKSVATQTRVRTSVAVANR